MSLKRGTAAGEPLPRHTPEEPAEAFRKVVVGLAGVPEDQRLATMVQMIPDEPKK